MTDIIQPIRATCNGCKADIVVYRTEDGHVHTNHLCAAAMNLVIQDDDATMFTLHEEIN